MVPRAGQKKKSATNGPDTRPNRQTKAQIAQDLNKGSDSQDHAPIAKHQTRLSLKLSKATAHSKGVTKQFKSDVIQETIRVIASEAQKPGDATAQELLKEADEIHVQKQEEEIIVAVTEDAVPDRQADDQVDEAEEITVSGSDVKAGKKGKGRTRRQATKKRKSRDEATSVKGEGNDGQEAFQPESPRKRMKTGWKGYTPGISPYPDWDSPSADACETVYKLLADHHKDQSDWFLQRDAVPRASLETAGCGEVKKVVDALLRTVLSASTSMESANESLKNLVKKFGVLFKATEEESVNWDAVRQASHQEVEECIYGGLQILKRNFIKGILDEIYEQGLARSQSSEEAGNSQDHAPTTSKSEAEKKLAEDKTIMDILSLEYIRTLPKEQAIKEMVKFNGIGLKTAACVSLFCLRHDTFAVDTHVWRFCKWLGWVPTYAKEIHTFNHCEIHVPDHLKYGLHQLFIMHGRKCYRCDASNRPGSQKWDDCVCPLEHLLNRGKKLPVDKNQKTIDGFFKRKTRKSKTDEEAQEKSQEKSQETSQSDSQESQEQAGELTQMADAAAEAVLNLLLGSQDKLADGSRDVNMEEPQNEHSQECQAGESTQKTDTIDEAVLDPLLKSGTQVEDDSRDVMMEDSQNRDVGDAQAGKLTQKIGAAAEIVLNPALESQNPVEDASRDLKMENSQNEGSLAQEDQAGEFRQEIDATTKSLLDPLLNIQGVAADDSGDVAMKDVGDNEEIEVGDQGGTNMQTGLGLLERASQQLQAWGLY